MNFKTKGFTLIELLVVIAIIGILSSVVLASLNSARTKGADVAVRSNLANIRAQAEIVYDSASPNSYNGICTEETIVNAINSAKSAAGITSATGVTLATAQGASTAVCHANGSTGWAISVPLKSSNSMYACVDGTGSATTTASVLSGNDINCNPGVN